MMCDTLVWSFDAIANVSWLEVLKAFSPVATALIAFFALKNWQRQDKAKREAEFLDGLIEATHTYIAEMPRPITLLEIARIGMESHAPTWENRNDANQLLKGAIAYIQKNGEKESERLRDVLEAVQPSAIKLRSLTVKGQMFEFDGYAKCQKAVSFLVWQLDRLEAFSSILGSTSLNWDNAEVQRHLMDVVAIDQDEMRKIIQASNVEILEFASKTYKRIYG
jgi:hypothetical protein